MLFDGSCEWVRMIRRRDYGWFCESCGLGCLLQRALMTSWPFDAFSEQVLRALGLLPLSKYWDVHRGDRSGEPDVWVLSREVDCELEGPDCRQMELGSG